MTTDLSLDTLRDLVADVLDVDAASMTDDTEFVEDLGMESLMALEVMVALEKRYKIKLKEADLGQLKSLLDVQALLTKKLAG